MPLIHIPPAPAPVSGDAHYTHTQNTPLAVWTINHNLGKYPAVATEDSAGEPVDGVVDYVNQYTLTITFSAAFGGVAFLN